MSLLAKQYEEPESLITDPESLRKHLRSLRETLKKVGLNRAYGGVLDQNLAQEIQIVLEETKGLY